LMSLDVSELESAVYFVTIYTQNGSITKRLIKK
ncbi:MAG: T9SS type A sorting domain-containing protein, partial [Flavobacteriaceae bacterium]|nr:T9SS type A sorting domain-containing protein [Flavobacteriaceae bacterium]